MFGKQRNGGKIRERDETVGILLRSTRFGAYLRHKNGTTIVGEMR